MIKTIYEKQEINFSLIAAVVEGTQKGQILQNREINPAHFFVINKFGFCQEFFSEFDENFFEITKKLILKKEYKKLRCYSPTEKIKIFLDSLDFAQKSERIQFGHVLIAKKINLTTEFKFEKINKNNIKLIDFGLDLSNRYWNGEQDFIDNANAIAAFDYDKPIGVCYSAGNGLNKAEIDIFIDENYRKKGLGYILGSKFIEECLKKQIIPSWDCYSNNINSINLAKKLGFEEKFKYDYYNIIGDRE